MINGVVRLLISAGWSPPHITELRVRGRKSGTLRTTLISPITFGGRRYVFASSSRADWVANVRAQGKGILRRSGQTERVWLVEVPPEERAPILREFARQLPTGSRSFRAKPDDPPEAFAAEVDEHPVFEIVPACANASMLRADLED
jgi:deazaflavin-dependent oxidoreductase (nitroreductase family)